MLQRLELFDGPYSAMMSSFVASLFAEVVGTLLSRPVRSAAELVGSVDVSVNDSTPTKLPKSVGDELTSCGSGDAASKQHPSLSSVDRPVSVSSSVSV